MPTIAGSQVPREQVLELASRLARNGADFTSRLLLDAITYRREIISLNADDRENIRAAIASLSTDFGELRDALACDGAPADTPWETRSTSEVELSLDRTQLAAISAR